MIDKQLKSFLICANVCRRIYIKLGHEALVSIKFPTFSKTSMIAQSSFVLNIKIPHSAPVLILSVENLEPRLIERRERKKSLTKSQLQTCSIKLNSTKQIFLKCVTESFLNQMIFIA